MTTPISASPLDRLAQRFDRPARIIKLVQELEAEDRELARGLVRDLFKVMVQQWHGNLRAAEGTNRLTKYDQIASMFVRHNNPWLSKVGISAQAKVTDSAVHDAIYGKNKDNFEDRLSPDGGRWKVYRLTTQVLDAVRASLEHADILDQEGGESDDT